MRRWQAVGLFCEDIREEARSLHTLIGVMPGNMRVPRIPGAFARLGMYVRVHVEAAATDVGDIGMTLVLPDGNKNHFDGFTTDQVNVELQKAIENGLPHAGFMLQAVGTSVPIKAQGRIELVATIGNESIICASMRVFQEATVSSVSEQPPAQSPPAS